MSATTTAAMPVAEGHTILLDLWLAEKAARIFQAAPPADCSVSEWDEGAIVLSRRARPRLGWKVIAAVWRNVGGWCWG